MGLFNNFFGSKKRKDVVDNNKLNKKSISLSYNPSHNNGIVSAEVSFLDLVNIEGKELIRANVGYDYAQDNKEDTLLIRKNRTVLLEPHYTKNENGEQIEDTAKYYEKLSQEGEIRWVKGFFRYDDIDRISREQDGSNYIGILNYRSDGSPERKYDEDFKIRYIRKLKNDKKLKEQGLQKELKGLVNNAHNHSGYQAMLENEDARHNGKYDLTQDQR